MVLKALCKASMLALLWLLHLRDNSACILARSRNQGLLPYTLETERLSMHCRSGAKDCALVGTTSEIIPMHSYLIHQTKILQF